MLTSSATLTRRHQRRPPPWHPVCCTVNCRLTPRNRPKGCPVLQEVFQWLFLMWLLRTPGSGPTDVASAQIQTTGMMDVVTRNWNGMIVVGKGPAPGRPITSAPAAVIRFPTARSSAGPVTSRRSRDAGPAPPGRKGPPLNPFRILRILRMGRICGKVVEYGV